MNLSPELREQFDALKTKASIQQMKQEICEESGQHAWGEVYWSQIAPTVEQIGSGLSRNNFDSMACLRCGTRMSRIEGMKCGYFTG